MNKSELRGGGSAFADLQNLIDITPDGGALNLYQNYAYEPGDNVITINKPITINGQGHTLDGKSASSIFCIKGNPVTLKNIRFINANNIVTDYGGAIYLQGFNCQITSCTFIDNTAQHGGAVYWSGDNGASNYCSFNNNNAKYYGGAVYWEGANGALSYSSFNNNHAKKLGGAVCWNVNNGKLSGCLLLITMLIVIKVMLFIFINQVRFIIVFLVFIVLKKQLLLMLKI